MEGALPIKYSNNNKKRNINFKAFRFYLDTDISDVTKLGPWTPLN